MTKKIEFTQNELSSLFGFLAMNGQQLPEDINTKVKAALHGPNGCTVSLTDMEICFTPAAAYQKVSERKEKAKINSEVAELRRGCLERDKQIELCSQEKAKALELTSKAVEVIQGIIDKANNPDDLTVAEIAIDAHDFINNKLS